MDPRYPYMTGQELAGPPAAPWLGNAAMSAVNAHMIAAEQQALAGVGIGTQPGDQLPYWGSVGNPFSGPQTVAPRGDWKARPQGAFDEQDNANLGTASTIVVGMRNQTILDTRGRSLATTMVGLMLTYEILPPYIIEPPPGNLLLNAFCTLEWGVGNAFHVFEFDLIRGTAFSVPASSIRLTCTYPEAAASEHKYQPPIVVKATVGYGTRSASSGVVPPTRRTSPQLALNAAGGAGDSSAWLRIPAGAICATVQANSLAANVVLEQAAGPGSQYKTLDAPSNNIPTPTVNGMQYYRITNLANASVDVFAIWYLSV